MLHQPSFARMVVLTYSLVLHSHAPPPHAIFEQILLNGNNVAMLVPGGSPEDA